MANLPILKGTAAISIKETIKNSKIKPYSDEEKRETEKRIQQILKIKKEIPDENI